MLGNLKAANNNLEGKTIGTTLLTFGYYLTSSTEAFTLQQKLIKLYF